MSDALKNAVVEAAEWHEAADKALSKQPPSGDRAWRRAEHQEQAAKMRAALAALDAHFTRATAETVRVAKMVQIAVCQSDSDGSGCLYALMDDGRLFSRRPAYDAPWQEQATPTSLATLHLNTETES